MTLATTDKRKYTHRGTTWIESLFAAKLYTGPMTQRHARKTFGVAFVRAGVCRRFGAAECHSCPLASRIPRADCNPPDECPTCPQRQQCPCGNADLRAWNT